MTCRKTSDIRLTLRVIYLSHVQYFKLEIMTTQEVANQLISLCREGKYEEVYQTLFSPEIQSKEPDGSLMPIAIGFDQLAEKGKKWNEMVDEFIEGTISDPIVAGDHFACTMKSRVKFKGAPEAIEMDEVCVYKVADGKVVLEQFFYTPMPQEA